jgi:hypothetical protein
VVRAVLGFAKEKIPPSPGSCPGSVLCLKLNCLNSFAETAGVVGEEGDHDAEYGVTEAADVQDVAAIRDLARVRVVLSNGRLAARLSHFTILDDVLDAAESRRYISLYGDM